MRPIWWRVYVALGAVATVTYAVTPAGLAADTIYALVGLSSVAAIAVGLRAHRPASRAPWILMLAGQLSWVVGDADLTWREDIVHSTGFPALGNAFYLAGYPLLAAALVLLVRGRRPQRDVAGVLDSAVVTVGLALLSWVLIGRPSLDVPHYSALTGFVSFAYPAADILLVGGVVRLIMTPGVRTATFRLLMTAVVLLVVGDTATTALGMWSGGAFSSWCNVTFLVSYVAWGAAAMHGSMTTLTERDHVDELRFTRKRLAALVVASLIAPGVLAVEQLAGRPLDIWAVVIGSVVLFGLVVARMKVAISRIVAEQAHRERLQADLAFQANHDGLTGLPNRSQALDTISAALGRAQRGGNMVGLLFVDLDGFKAVNDSYGHAAGDRVLQVAAQRLHEQVRVGDLLARLGGDEFVVVLEQLDSESDALHVGQRLVAAAAEAITVPGQGIVRIGASVGMAVAQDASTDADRLLHEADTAAYRAKAAGRGCVEVFGDALRGELAERAELEDALRHAIRHDELVVHYQPIIDVATSDTRGYEALVRWQRPGHGLVAPVDFIPTAEESPLICELDAWVLQVACKQLAQWSRSAGSDQLTVAVNISGRHLSLPRVVDDVRKALLAAGLPGRQLVLEITETVLVENLLALHHLHQLRELGVAVSIDDFGTGYNSFARLRGLPVDIIKIDRSFLVDTTDAPSRKLLELMVHAAHAFDIPVVAEGVENERQLEMLRDLDCESAQGFHLCRPLPAEQIVHVDAVSRKWAV